MDGQNYDNGSSQDLYQQNQQNAQQNHYQDNTGSMSYYAPVDENVPRSANGLQIGGLVLGIIGLVLSIVGNKKGKHGVGMAGLICSIIGLVLGTISAIYYTAIIAQIFQAMQRGEFNPYDYYNF